MSPPTGRNVAADDLSAGLAVELSSWVAADPAVGEVDPQEGDEGHDLVIAVRLGLETGRILSPRIGAARHQ